jgi:hypothetical protein
MVSGAIFGAGMGLGFTALGLIAGPQFALAAGMLSSTVGYYHAHADMKINGPNACNGTQMLLAIAGLFLGAQNFHIGPPMSGAYAGGGTTAIQYSSIVVVGNTVTTLEQLLSILSLYMAIEGGGGGGIGDGGGDGDGGGGSNGGWGTEAEFWAGRNAYEAEVREIPSRAYAKIAAGEFGTENAEHEAAVWANMERRQLGIKYKNMTVPKILEEIYRRNLKFYGDKLGPTMKYYMDNGYSDQRIIASSGKPGGKDLITWVVENTGWDITNWASWGN